MEKTSNKRDINYGDVYIVDFEGHGSEQSGKRPAMIVSNNVGNRYAPNVIVLPITSKIKKTNMPTHVFISSKDTELKTDSMILCENPVCLSKEKLGWYITTLSDKILSKVAVASTLASGGIGFIDPSDLEELWKRAAKLNNRCIA